MKTSKLAIALASLLMLASCNQPHATGLSSSSASKATGLSSSSSVKKTMGFLKDGEFYADVPNDVIAPVDETVPYVYVNGIHIAGNRTDKLEGKFELRAERAFAKDIYVSVAYSTGEGHLAAKAFGPIAKETISEGLATVAEVIGVPNKVFIALSTNKASWPTNLDKEMDEAIQGAWDLIA